MDISVLTKPYDQLYKETRPSDIPGLNMIIWAAGMLSNLKLTAIIQTMTDLSSGFVTAWHFKVYRRPVPPFTNMV